MPLRVDDRRPRRPTGAKLLVTVRPDFVFRKERVAVFVASCFWHGCPQNAAHPRNTGAFWRQTLAGNRARDRRVNQGLRRAGWRVPRLWEHELTPRYERRLAARLRRFWPATTGTRATGPAAQP